MTIGISGGLAGDCLLFRPLPHLFDPILAQSMGVRVGRQPLPFSWCSLTLVSVTAKCRC